MDYEVQRYKVFYYFCHTNFTIMNMRLLLFSLLTLAATAASASRPRLAEDIMRIIGDDHIGVAVIFSDGDTLALDGNTPFELQSVAKFHQAVALANKIGYPAIMIDSVTVTPADLLPNTWSPLRAAYPQGLTLTLPNLLYQSLVMSDNNAADIIFDRYVSPSETDSILHALGSFGSYGIAVTEAQMHDNPALSALNYSTPLATARLMDHFFTADTTAAATVIRAVMSGSVPLGAARIPAGIPTGQALVFHKTGTGFDRPDGSISALNDAAFVCYTHPDGSTGYYTLVIFMADFAGARADGEQKIADISQAVWNSTVLERVKAMNASATVYPAQRRAGTAAAPDAESFGSALMGTIFEAVLDQIIFPDSD